MSTPFEMPEFPGLDKILETAEKMYDFVNAGSLARAMPRAKK